MSERSFEAEREAFLNQIAADTSVTKSGLRFGIVVASYVNRRVKEAWPSLDKMARDFGIDRSALNDGKKNLVKRGHVRLRPGVGRGPNHYEWVLVGLLKGGFSSANSTPTKPRRSSANSTPTNTETSGAVSTTTTRESDAMADDPSGGGFAPVVEVDLARSGSQTGTLTSENLRGTAETGRPYGAEPGSPEDADPYDSPLWLDRGALPPHADDDPALDARDEEPDPPPAPPLDPGQEERAIALSWPERPLPNIRVSGWRPRDYGELFDEVWSLAPWTEDQSYARLIYARALQRLDPSAIVHALQLRPVSEPTSLAAWLEALAPATPLRRVLSGGSNGAAGPGHRVL